MGMPTAFRNRQEAGRLLGAKLAGYTGDPTVLVLGLPRGGVPVAYEVAHALHAPLDVFLVRKLGVPGHRELAMGAIASGGLRVLNPEVIDAFSIPRRVVDAVTNQELIEIERQEKAYRGSAAPARWKGRKIIVVDDGLATGSTMRAAVRALHESAPERVVVAVPVAAAETAGTLREEADGVVSLIEPADFRAVSLWYQDFSQTTDDEVRGLLEASAPVSRPA
jgi:putative phosphoribosyl transferase